MPESSQDLLRLELKTEVTGNDFINEEYQAVVSDIRKYTEYACAKGGLAMNLMHQKAYRGRYGSGRQVLPYEV